MGIFLAIPLVIFFYRVIFFGEYFFENDITQIFYPLYLFTVRSIQQGEIPYWNPLSRVGVPHIADPQAGFFFPVWAGGLVFPEDRYFQWLIIGALFFGGLGCYFWVNSLVKNPAAAIFSGMVFELQGFWIAKIFYTSMLWTIAWVPWVFWSARRYGLEPSWKNRLLFLLFWAFQLFAGHPQIWSISTLFLLLYLTFSFGMKIWKRLLWDGILLMGLTAVQWLPTLELVQNSLRWHLPGMPLVFPTAIGGWHTLRYFFIPYPGGVRTPSEDSVYIGWTAFLLVVVGLWFSRKHWNGREKVMLVLILLSIVFSVGPDIWLNFWQKFVYPFSFFLHPARFLLMASFFLITLAGIAIASLKFDKNLPLMASLYALGMGELLWWNWGYNFTTTEEYFRSQPEFIRLLGKEGKNPLFRSDFLEPRPYSHFTWEGDKILPTPFARTFVSVQYEMPFSGIAGHGPFLLRTQEFLFHPEVVRDKFMDFLGIRWLIVDKQYTAKIPFGDLVEAKEGDRYRIYQNLEALPRIFLARRYQKVESRAKKMMKKRWEQGELPSYVWKVVEKKFPSHVFEKPNWDPWDAMLMEEDPPKGWQEADDLPQGSLQILTLKSTEIVVQVDVPAPRVLVVVENFYPGWKVWIDGKPGKILMGNGIARTVPIPEGKHRIKMRYVPTIYFLGGIIFMFSAGILGYMLWRDARKKG